MSVVRDVSTSCSGAFLISIHFRRPAAARFTVSTRARISPAQGRVLSTASRFSPESCIRENFPNLRHAGPTIRALSGLLDEAEGSACHPESRRRRRTSHLVAGSHKVVCVIFRPRERSL